MALAGNICEKLTDDTDARLCEKIGDAACRCQGRFG